MRLMTALAERIDETPADLTEISVKEGVSMKYLSQIIIPLKSAGLVVSYRGAAGGYRLSRSPGDITALEIYEAIDGPLTMVDCTREGEECGRSPECVTISLWRKLEDAIRITLRTTSLRDLVENRRASGRDALNYVI
jgi:Rrf2 family protein